MEEDIKAGSWRHRAALKWSDSREEETETAKHKDELETSFLPWIPPAAYCQSEPRKGQDYFQLTGK